MTSSRGPISDEELHAALARRVDAGPLTPDQRIDLIRNARLALTSRGAGEHGLLRRFWQTIATVAAVLVFVVAVGPVLVTAPGRTAAPSSAAPLNSPSAPVKTTSPSEAPGALTVYSADQLSAMVGEPEWIDRTVLAPIDAFGFVEMPTPCVPAQPCTSLYVEVGSRQFLVDVDWRDSTREEGQLYDGDGGARWIELVSPAPEGGVYAFRVANTSVVLLGPARLSTHGAPMTPREVSGAATDEPSDDVYVVRGWLAQGLPISCPAPNEYSQTPLPALDFHCSRTWLASSRTMDWDLAIPAAMQLQNSAYDEYASDPLMTTNGYEPREGTYLVRNAGCELPRTFGDCPVWRMVGRLDDPQLMLDPDAPTAAPETTTDAPEATSPAPPDAPTPAVHEPLRIGDRVRATGYVRGSDSLGLRICESQPSILLPRPTPSGGATPGCPAEISVAIDAVDGAELPGWTPSGDGGSSGYVEVIGIWTGEAITADDVRAVARPERFKRDVPCDPPSDGWPGDLPQSIQGEQMALRIQEVVDSDPERFAGLWSGFTDPANEEAGRALVVAVIDDAAAAQVELEEIYAYNLCIFEVEFSRAELTAIEQALQPFTVAWRPTVDGPSNRVVVELAFVDELAVTRVAPFGHAVVFDPVVERITE